MAECLCDKCVALCCRYFALPISRPKTLKDYDDIRWYLVHENVVVFVEKGQWYLAVLNKCRHLQDDNRCGIYHTRPRICRGYSTDNCDWHGGEYDFTHLFTSAEQLQRFAEEAVKQRRKKRRAAGPKQDQKATRKPARKQVETVMNKGRRNRAIGEAIAGRSAGRGIPSSRGVNGNGRAVALPVIAL